MNISDEAVNAAAKATFEHANAGSPWEDAGTFWKDAYRASVLAGIEAAAPHMLADLTDIAYSQGYKDGARGLGRDGKPIGAAPVTRYWWADHLIDGMD